MLRILFFCLAVGTAHGQATTPSAPRLSLGEARDGIVAATNTWTRARLALDTAAFNRTLLPEFHAVMNPMNPQARLSRGEFLTVISTPSSGSRLSRFDSTILTVRRTPTGFEAIVEEKLEFTVTGADGTVTRNHALWITRDGWRQAGSEWKLEYSEAVGMQGWNAPARPPFTDW